MMPRLSASLVVVFSVSVNLALGQESATSGPPFRVANDSNWGKQQTLVSQLAAEGYVVSIGRPVDSLVIMRRRTDNEPVASYQVLQSKKDILKELAKGWRAVPGTVDVSQYGTCVVIARKALDGEAAEAMVLETTRASTLDDQIREARMKGFHVVGIASGGGGHAAVLERLAGAAPEPTAVEPKAFVAEKGKEAIQKALAASAAAGYRIEQATAFNEMRLALGRREGEPPVEYRVLSATRNETFSDQINAAATEGFSITPGTLHAVQKGSVFGLTPRMGSEFIVVMQRSAGDVPRVEYFLVGVRRRSTLTSEFDAAVAAGWAPVAAVIGFQEQDTLVLFERPRR